MELLTPEYKTVMGVTTKVYPETGSLMFGSFRTFGGTEVVKNDLLVLEDTATIETWYNSNIEPDCRIKVGTNTYEILGTPENLNMRNQFMILKVRRLKAGA